MTTARDIVERAFRKLGVVASDEPMTADQAANGIDTSSTSALEILDDTKAGIEDDAAGLAQRLDRAVAKSLEKDRPGGRKDQRPGSGMDLPPFQDPGGDRQVLDPAVRAGSDENLLDGRAGDLADGLDVVDGVGAGDLGFER